MAKGLKTGGRRKGSRNKAPQAQAAAIAASGLTPLEFLLSVLRDPEKQYAARIDAAKAAAPYVHPKLANIELTGKDKGPLEVNIVRYSPTQPVGSTPVPDAAVDRAGGGL